MKKLLTLALALVMVLVMTMSVCALDVPGTEDQNVYIQIQATDPENPETPITPVAVYSVNLVWDDITFTYGNAIWDPASLSYKDGQWDKTSANIKVENRSNAPVSVKATFTNGSTVTTMNGVTGTLSNDSFTLLSAENSAGNGPTNTIGLAISGTPTSSTNFELSKITVTLAKIPTA